MPTAFVYDPRFLAHLTGSAHPENPRRLEVVLEALESETALWRRLIHAEPVEASFDDLGRCHSLRLIDEIREAVQNGHTSLDADTRISRDSLDAARRAAGAAIRGVDLVMAGQAANAFAAVRPPGHHACPDRAMGFCLFNNVAIATRYAQSRYDVGRVLVVDWDVHHGNGTQDIFYEDSSVFFFSAHQYPWYPGTGSRLETGEGEGRGATLNLPLPARTPAATHREAFREALRSIGKRFEPDLVFISAGFDSRRGDPLGGLLLEDRDFAEMTLEVMNMAGNLAGGRVVSVLEGGYNLDLLGLTVAAHVGALAGMEPGN